MIYRHLALQDGRGEPPSQTLMQATEDQGFAR